MTKTLPKLTRIRVFVSKLFIGWSDVFRELKEQDSQKLEKLQRIRQKREERESNRQMEYLNRYMRSQPKCNCDPNNPKPSCKYHEFFRIENLRKTTYKMRDIHETRQNLNK